VADRFAPRRVFLICALAAAACTLAAAVFGESVATMAPWRFATGFLLAGIYPVGMKIAAVFYPRGLGVALGWLVGALVLGSASPHALRALAAGGLALPWQMVFGAVALACIGAGALIVWAVPPSPRSAAAVFRWQALASIWTDRRVRASAFGYFGHMVELYTMWVLVPLILAARLQGVAVSWGAFTVLGAGVIGCVAGGLLAPRFGSARVAAVQLAASGLCCLAAPLMLAAPWPWFAAWLLLWGITVAGDSPQFSALTASNAPPGAVGSVLTLVNSIGFAISIVSIEAFVRLAQRVELASLLPWLAIGPMLGLWMLMPLWRTAPAALR
jgi:MFS family permease